MTPINNDRRNTVVTNSQDNKVVGNGITTTNGGTAQKSSSMDPNSTMSVGKANQSGTPGNVAKSAISDITKSTTNDILKSLISNFTSDGKIDKGELNQLKQFLTLLSDLQPQDSDETEREEGDVGTPAMPTAPAVGGTGGSQAPPIGTESQDGLGLNLESGSAKNATVGTPEPGLQGSASMPGPDGETSSGASNMVPPPAGKQGGVTETAGDAKGNGAQGGDQPGRANRGQETNAAQPATERSAARGTGRGSDQASASGLTGGNAASRQAYAKLERAAKADGTVSTREQKALDNYADKYGIKDQSKATGGSSSKGNLDQVLKNILNASGESGINENKDTAISNLIKAGAGKNLSEADKTEMMTKFMEGAEKDGNFSEKDLKTFNELLSLVSSSGSNGPGASSASGDGGAQRLTSAGPGYGAYMNQLFGSIVGSDSSDSKDDDSKIVP